ncbi:MAG: hypothetical protein DLM72_17900 [Candidatus Nitrosopolaris wilkensis]|nr:MAG: hypothetical protein DLM72_17900 [Candidatus Nitrosopolaris wilkensis]
MAIANLQNHRAVSVITQNIDGLPFNLDEFYEYCKRRFR